MAYPNRYFRRNNFSNDKLLGKTFDPAALDTDFNDIVQTLQQLNDFCRAGQNADKTPKTLTPLPAKDLLSLNRFVATAAQTDFTVPVYANGVDIPMAYTIVGGATALIDPALVTATSSTVVTLPAQTVGTVVVILIFTAGSGLLTKLADNTTLGNGASLIGLRDAGGLFVATEVESALAEAMRQLNTLLTNLGPLLNYVKTDGAHPFVGDQPMGNHTLTGLRAGLTAGEAVRYEQLQAVIAQITGVTTAFLPKTGGTMAGAINMNGIGINAVLDPVLAQDAATKHYVDALLASFGGLPIGAVVDCATSAIPSGWLLCDGSAVSRATYANLFAAIGVTYGVGDGTTTFNLPDTAGRFTIGVGTGAGLTARNLADKGGEENHVLTVAELPAHHHLYGFQNTGTTGGGGGGSFGTTNNTADTGGGIGHNTVPPFVAFKKIIKF